jgi:hypothetical protein
MSEKHLTELAWKAIAVKQGVKDLGLQKALGAYAKLDAGKEPAKILEALKEISELALRLKKTCTSKADVVDHLDEMVKEVKKTIPALDARIKATEKPEEVATDDEEAKEAAEFKKDLKKQMISALAQVKLRAPGDSQQDKEPKPQLKFMACLAGTCSSVVVARKVGSSTKKLLCEISGIPNGGKFVQGECMFEKNAHTFVLEQVPGGLAKKLAKALYAATSTQYKVRVRSTDGSVTLDSDTDVDPDTVTSGKDPAGGTSGDPATLFTKRLSAWLPNLKAAAGTPAGDEAKSKASEAGLFARKKDFVQANLLLDQAQAALKRPAASGSSDRGQSSAAANAPPGPARGLVEKRKFLVERWQRIPQEVHADLKELKEAIAREIPGEDAELWIDLVEDYLGEFYSEMKEAIDDDINSGDAQYQNAIGNIRAFRTKIAAEPLIQHLKTNALKVDVSVESTLLDALAEVEQALAN